MVLFHNWRIINMTKIDDYNHGEYVKLPYILYFKYKIKNTPNV